MKFLALEDEKERQRRKLLTKKDDDSTLDMDYVGILGILHKTEGYKEFCGVKLTLNF